MSQERVREEWRKAALSVAENMLEDCNYWTSRLQPRKRSLTAEECFHPWSSLGNLRFQLWQNTLPNDEADRIREDSKKLREQLSEAVQRYTVPHASTSILLVRLETEMKSVVKETRRNTSRAKEKLQNHELAESWGQTEFDSLIQDPMDRIGYAIEMSKSMKLTLSKTIMESIAALDQEFRVIFPEAVRQYRESGQYPIDSGRPVWPESFWWRPSNRI